MKECDVNMQKMADYEQNLEWNVRAKKLLTHQLHGIAAVHEVVLLHFHGLHLLLDGLHTHLLPTKEKFSCRLSMTFLEELYILFQFFNSDLKKLSLKRSDNIALRQLHFNSKSAKLTFLCISQASRKFLATTMRMSFDIVKWSR